MNRRPDGHSAQQSQQASMDVGLPASSDQSSTDMYYIALDENRSEEKNESTRVQATHLKGGEGSAGGL